MITEAILIVFAIVYYLFCAFAMASVIEDNETIKDYCISILLVVIASPIAVPPMLGIWLGIKMRDKL